MPIRTQIWTVGPQPEPLKNAVLASEQFLEDMIVSAPALRKRPANSPSELQL